MTDTPNHRQTFGQRLCHTGRLWRRVVDKQLSAYGLTEAKWLPLLYASRAKKPLRQKDLAERVCIDGSSLVRLIDALTADGLMERQTGEDRRTNLLALTAAGRERVAKVETTLAELRGRLLSDISDTDIAVTLSVIERIAAILAETNAQPAPPRQPTGEKR